MALAPRRHGARNNGRLLTLAALALLATFLGKSSIRGDTAPLVDDVGGKAQSFHIGSVSWKKTLGAAVLIAAWIYEGKRGKAQAAKGPIAHGDMHDSHNWLHQLNHTLESGAGSALLGVCALVSMVLANLSSTSESWTSIWSLHVGPPVGGHALTVKGWVNEGLMALFFFQVGLEIKKEMTEGALASVSQAALPCIAALGGMVVPMGIYAIINTSMSGGSLDGMTIPMATDIAFAMGVFSLFKKQMPSTSAPFLLALATADDLGAIAVIAVCFAGTISPVYLAASAATLLAAILLGRKGFHGSSWFFVVPGVGLWYFMLRGGINADVAGVLVALCVPMRCLAGSEVVERLIHRWAPVCAMFILPVFALANCAVTLGGGDSGEESTSYAVPMGVALGLMLGKPLGICGFTMIACKLGVSKMPEGMKTSHLVIVGMLGSIGFTMCLFLIECSLTGPVASITKLSVLLASVLSAALSAFAMAMLPPAPKIKGEKEGHDWLMGA